MDLITGENDNGRRLDRILRKALPDHPLHLIHKLLRLERILVNGKPGKAQDRIESGAVISISFTNNLNKHDQRTNAQLKHPEKLNLKRESNETKPGCTAEAMRTAKAVCVFNELEKMIIWQDSGLIAFNKPKGLAVHGPCSLDTFARLYLKDKLPPSLSFNPGPLHRLDKPSSGIVMFSKSLEGARVFSSLMHERKIKKTYLAITEGSIEKEEIWQDEIVRDKDRKKTFVAAGRSSKTAVTRVIPIKAAGGFSLISAEIFTGRTHQIRAQAAAHSHPLSGDLKYGGMADRELEIMSKKSGKRRKNQEGNKVNFFLHAWRLEFSEHLIEAPPPQEFSEMIDRLFGKIAYRFRT